MFKQTYKFIYTNALRTEFKRIIFAFSEESQIRFSGPGSFHRASDLSEHLSCALIYQILLNLIFKTHCFSDEESEVQGG